MRKRLVELYCLRGCNFREYKRGDVEGEEDECYGHRIDEEYDERVDDYVHLCDVIVGGVELEQMEVVLQQEDCEGYAVAQNCSLEGDEHGEADEEGAQLSVGGAHGLEHAYSGGALKHDDEQSAADGKDRYACHQGEDDPHIGVEDV